MTTVEQDGVRRPPPAPQRSRAGATAATTSPQVESSPASLSAPASLGTLDVVNVMMTAEAREYVEDHGGRLYVRPRRTRCCGGGLTFLEAATAPPESLDDYEAAGPGVWYRHSAAGEPGELLVELRGFWRKRPVASWDGCAFKP